ncbi:MULTISPECIES: multidrug efflux SMR transporter [Vagococcus]|uniref:Ethidium bromide-methyl viologen resistance protein EmrE n=1 Tax=Vagococcus fluvialis bH819 TaxID=1255619 RepID=A0A1X6WP38_9ENTE|nr:MULTISPECIES: multidrug efflux SMR transporter [Vagococcus]SLM86093.1 Ethidium bromide-methyl viologen resistance protein EmrE [Vagococcus fluvialis bH819]HCM90342.1 QacE family quaternary ammonium compound efflux SMR transporter [Vagococcus sp.]
MKGYIFLLVAILGEVVGTNLLKATDGFTKLAPTLYTIVAYVISFYFLSLSFKTIPIAVAYAIWGAIGIILITLFSVLIWKEPLNLMTVVGLILIILGTIIVNVYGTGH